VLDNVLIARCQNHEQQHEMLAAVAAKITDAEEPVKLLIVDSVMGLFRVEFSGRGELAERQQKLGQHIRELVKIASEFNVAVLLTNQVTADPGNMFVSDAKKPVGGNILAHYVHTRVYLRKGKGNQRIAKSESTSGASDARRERKGDAHARCHLPRHTPSPAAQSTQARCPRRRQPSRSRRAASSTRTREG
jgi:RecA/RadA recombinase